MQLPEGTLPMPGELIAGKYRMDRLLGRGGMGIVIAAEHVDTRQRVAVKFLLADAASRVPDSPERFLREAEAASAIRSPHIARILEVGRLSNGAPYMVMEYLSGKDLGAFLAERGTLPAQEAVTYMLQACEGMAAAHAAGIIHRDLKPPNLFLNAGPDGAFAVKVLDFGLAKAIPKDGPEENLTQTGVVMGSVYYMSPEQMRSLKRADARSDIWSLGIIMYELVTGRPPFIANTLPASLMKIGLDPPPPITSPWIPPGLIAAIFLCLEKDPTKRPQSAAELARLLVPFGPSSGPALVRLIESHGPPRKPLQADGAAAPEPAKTAPPAAAPAASSTPSNQALATVPKKRRGCGALFGVLTALACAAGLMAAALR